MWLTRSELALQLNECLIGAIKPPRQDGRNVEECGWVSQKDVRRVGHVELRGLQSSHVRSVWLVQQN
jgi:hypothetical protein